MELVRCVGGMFEGIYMMVHVRVHVCVCMCTCGGVWVHV